MATNFDCPLCGSGLEGQPVGARCPQCSLVIVPGAGVTRPRELFIMGIRLLGVWFLTETFQYGVAALSTWRTLAPEYAESTIESYALSGAATLVLGVYCLLGAPQLVGLTYGHRVPRAGDSSRSEPPQSSG